MQKTAKPQTSKILTQQSHHKVSPLLCSGASIRNCTVVRSARSAGLPSLGICSSGGNMALLRMVSTAYEALGSVKQLLVEPGPPGGTCFTLSNWFGQLGLIVPKLTIWLWVKTVVPRYPKIAGYRSWPIPHLCWGRSLGRYKWPAWLGWSFLEAAALQTKKWISLVSSCIGRYEDFDQFSIYSDEVLDFPCI